MTPRLSQSQYSLEVLWKEVSCQCSQGVGLHSPDKPQVRDSIQPAEQGKQLAVLGAGMVGLRIGAAEYSLRHATLIRGVPFSMAAG